MTLVCREIRTFHTRSPLIYRCQGLPYREKHERINSLGSWMWGRVLQSNIEELVARAAGVPLLSRSSWPKLVHT